jgi:hypothetical protein
MMNYIARVILHSALLFLFLVHSRANAKEEIYELIEPTKLARYSDITYFVRFPQGRGFEDSGRASSRKDVSVRGVLCSVCDGISPQSCPGLGTNCSGTTQLLCGGTFTGCEGGGDQTECSFGLGSCNADGGSNNACGNSTSTTCLWEEIGDGLYACSTSVTNTGACPKKDCSGTVL